MRKWLATDIFYLSEVIIVETDVHFYGIGSILSLKMDQQIGASLSQVCKYKNEIRKDDFEQHNKFLHQHLFMNVLTLQDTIEILIKLYGGSVFTAFTITKTQQPISVHLW